MNRAASTALRYLLLMIALIWPVAITGQVAYPYENFDNDATRVNSFFNLWGGNWGIMNAAPDHPYVRGGWFEPDGYSTDTRSGKGRCLRVSFEDGANVDWGGGIWSSVKLHVDSLEQTVDFTNLFGLLQSTELGIAKVDSIVFWAKAENLQGGGSSYILELEIRDGQNNPNAQASKIFEIPDDAAWHRFAAKLSDFTNWHLVNAQEIKKISILFKSQLNSTVSSGVIYLDDIAFIDISRNLPDLTSDADFLNYINLLNFRYFMEYKDSYGFALDRSAFADLVSVAAIGFQLTAYCIADKNGWLPPGLASIHVYEILLNLWEAPHGNEQQCIDDPFGYATCEGLWFHFLKSDSRRRIQPVAAEALPPELSLYDTALLMAGVLSCREYFDSNLAIRALADSLYLNVNWSFLLETNPDSLHYGRLYLGWYPESGFTHWAMDYHTEEDLLVNLLSLGSPRYPVPVSTFENVRREWGEFGGHQLVQSAPGALFTYLFAQIWCEFPDTPDSHPDIRLNHWDNTVQAILANQAYCETEYQVYDWWDLRIFGLSACEGPDSAFCRGPEFTNYHAYGALPALDPIDHDGTLSVYGAGASMMHTPPMAIEALRFYKTIPGLFNDMVGFYDAFHLDPDQYPNLCTQMGYNGPWISNYLFGIDTGPMLIMIDNYLSENAGINGSSIRQNFTANAYVQQSLALMYDSTMVAINPNPDHIPFHISLKQNYPNPFNPATFIEFEISATSYVNLAIFDILGRRVKMLVNESRKGGFYYVAWDGTDDSGRSIGSGIYICRLVVEHHGVQLEQTRRLNLTK